MIVQKKSHLENSRCICRLLLGVQNWQPSNPKWNAAVPLALTRALPLVLPQTSAGIQNRWLHIEAFAFGQNGFQLLLWEPEMADMWWQQGKSGQVYMVQRRLAGRRAEETVGTCKGKNAGLIAGGQEKPEGGAVGTG